VDEFEPFGEVLPAVFGAGHAAEDVLIDTAGADDGGVDEVRPGGDGDDEDSFDGFDSIKIAEEPV
jgi:hypothetical protein